MENASKALIIAGAILIAILLISVGIIIMNSSGNTQETVQSTTTSMEIQSFNAQLTPYIGTNLSAKQVRDFLDTVIVINSQAQGNKDKIVYVNYRAKGETSSKKKNLHKTSTTDLTRFKTYISDTSTYRIQLSPGCTLPNFNGGYKASGYIGCITIQTLT